MGVVAGSVGLVTGSEGFVAGRVGSVTGSVGFVVFSVVGFVSHIVELPFLAFDTPLPVALGQPDCSISHMGGIVGRIKKQHLTPIRSCYPAVVFLVVMTKKDQVEARYFLCHFL